jgi:hypothetical protein
MPIIAVFNSLVTSRYLFENDFNVRGEREKDQIAHFPSIISLYLVYSSNVIMRQPVSQKKKKEAIAGRLNEI